MKGKGIYLALAALIGILSAFISFLPFVLLMLVYLYFLQRFKSMNRFQILLISFVFLFYCGIGFFANHNNKTDLTGSEKDLAVILQKRDINGDVLTINGRVQATNEKLIIRYRFHSPQEKALLENNLKYGLNCTLTGKLEIPSSFKNPNVFNYQQYLSSKQTFWIFVPNDIPLEACPTPSPTFFSIMDQFRNVGMKYVAEHFPEPTASLAIALLFGEQSTMGDELVSAYQKIGIVHLLAISGLQVTFLSGVIFYCGLRLGIVREKMINVLMVFLPVYAILTGATPSVVRAVSMMLVILISHKWSKQRMLPLDALCYAFLFLLLVSPYLIYDIGFQLSFSACFALLLSSPSLIRNDTTLSQLILTSYVAQLGTLPIILSYFYEVSMLSIAANLMFVPFFSIFLTPFFFFVFLFHPILKFLIDPLIWITNKVIIIVNHVIDGLSELPLHMLVLGKPSKLLLFLLFIFIMVIFYKLEKEKTNRFRYSLLIAVPIIAIAVLQNWSPFGEVTFIDVGQGDSIFIRLPFNQGNYLIDTGGNLALPREGWQEKRSKFDVGEDVVIPFIKSKGITKLDKLILTHGDMDHIGGALAIIEGLKVEELLLPKVNIESELETELVEKANQKGIPITYVLEGNQWENKESIFKVLAPAEAGSGDDKNNQSIVLYAEIGGLSWLFTGDLEENGENLLVQKYPFIDVDVLKVGHHGSNSSSSEGFLRSVQPEITIISVGESNRYGHPHREVISRLTENNAVLYRTDQNGAISYFFKGRKGTFSVMLP